jgi:hypothetical protein
MKGAAEGAKNEQVGCGERGEDGYVAWFTHSNIFAPRNCARNANTR